MTTKGNTPRTINRLVMMLVMFFALQERCSSYRVTGRYPTTSRSALSLLPKSQKPQVLEFREPTTNVMVKLVGAMHYNPFSINLASSTCAELAESSRLAAVVVESCPQRWNKTLKFQPEGSFMRKIFDNEMQAAAEVAERNGLPVILGDQDIEATNKRLVQTLKQSIVDLLTPWRGGWKALYQDVVNTAQVVLPSGSDFLGPLDFVNPGLLVATPVSLVRYPLSYLVKSPAVGVPLIFSLTYAIMNAGDSSFVGTTLTERVTEVLTSALVFGIETAVFARVFLVALLAERNEILADNILEQCRRAAGSDSTELSKASPGRAAVWLPQWPFGTKSATEKGDASSASTDIDKVVVAVLGMAHCNGIRKLLVDGK